MTRESILHRLRQVDSTAVAVGSVAVVAAVIAHWSAFGDPWVVSDDARQHTYWMRQFLDPALFTNDLIVDYARNYQPWGWVALYRAAAWFVDPVVFGKILPIPLFGLAAMAVYAVARRLSTRFGGLFAAALFIATPAYLDRFAGGHPRAFGFPLLAAFLLMLIAERPVLAGVTLVLQTLFYPVMFPLCAGTWFLMLCIDAKGRRRWPSPRRLVVPALAVLVGIGVLIAKFELSVDARIGPIATRAELEPLAEVHEHGRYEILPTESLVRLLARDVALSVVRLRLPWRDRLGGLHLLIEPALICAAAGALGWGAFRRQRDFPRVLAACFAASLACFGVAELVLLRLFLPKRYLEYSVKLMALLLLAVALGRAVEQIPSARLRRAVQAACLAVVLLHAGAIDEAGLSDLSEGRVVHEALARLPADTLVAAHPTFADNIPLFARRSVFVDYEHSHPWYPVYWETLRTRTWDFFELYYAQDRATVGRVCERTGIDVIVVDRRHFSSSARPYIEPFGSVLRDRLRDRRHFALLEIDPQERLLDAPPYSIVACRE